MVIHVFPGFVEPGEGQNSGHPRSRGERRSWANQLPGRVKIVNLLMPMAKRGPATFASVAPTPWVWFPRNPQARRHSAQATALKCRARLCLLGKLGPSHRFHRSALPSPGTERSEGSFGADRQHGDVPGIRGDAERRQLLYKCSGLLHSERASQSKSRRSISWHWSRDTLS